MTFRCGLASCHVLLAQNNGQQRPANLEVVWWMLGKVSQPARTPRIQDTPPVVASALLMADPQKQQRGRLSLISLSPHFSLLRLFWLKGEGDTFSFTNCLIKSVKLRWPERGSALRGRGAAGSGCAEGAASRLRGSRLAGIPLQLFLEVQLAPEGEQRSPLYPRV